MHLATGYQVSFILNFLAGYYSNCGKGFHTDGHAIYVFSYINMYFICTCSYMYLAMHI